MQGYAGTVDHLLDELRRVDVLLARYYDECHASKAGEGGDVPGLFIADATVERLLTERFQSDRSGTAAESQDATSGTRTAGSGSETAASPDDGPYPDQSRGGVERAETPAGGPGVSMADEAVPPSQEADGNGLSERLREIRREIEARRAATDTTETRLALFELVERYELDQLCMDALLLALAPEFDRKYEKIYAYFHDDFTQTRPTVGLVLNVLCAAERERLETRARFARGSTLRSERLVTLSGDSDAPLLSRFLEVDERVVDFLVGSNVLDPALEPCTDVVTSTTALSALAVEQDVQEALDSLAERDTNAASADPPLATFAGPCTAQMDRAVEALAARAERPLVVADATRFVGVDDPMIRLRREVILRGADVHVRNLSALADTASPATDPETGSSSAGPSPSDAGGPSPSDAPSPSSTAAGSSAGTPNGTRSLLSRAVVLDELDALDQRVFLSDEEPLPMALQRRVSNHERFEVGFPMPSYDQRRTLWEAVDSLPEDVTPAELASKFRLTPGDIDAAVATAALVDEGERADSAGAGESAGPDDTADSDDTTTALTREALHRGCRELTRRTLGTHTRRIDPTYDWDDIVLPPDTLAHLQEVAGQIERQGQVYADWGFDEHFSHGTGLTVLFSGPPGTGKTMAAEVVAADVGLDLYQIDLSQVVSKYIGETESNLRSIFEEAEGSSAILLFDEADALFGERSEVRNSNDRYANVEVNYLLQKIEEHDGTVILTTNLERNIDDAFQRRIQISVPFQRPDREAREAIWRRVFPDDTPVGEVDVAFLSSFELTGSNIKNIALRAAFMAAQRDAVVEMRHVVRAVRRELEKSGKLVDTADFGPYQDHLEDGSVATNESTGHGGLDG